MDSFQENEITGLGASAPRPTSSTFSRAQEHVDFDSFEVSNEDDGRPYAVHLEPASQARLDETKRVFDLTSARVRARPLHDWSARLREVSREFPHYNLPAMRAHLLQGYDEDGVAESNADHVLWHVIHGIVHVGMCVSCVVAVVAPAAVPVAIALKLCDHVTERAMAYRFLAGGVGVTHTAGSDTPNVDDLGAAAALFEKQLGFKLPRREVVQLVASTLAAVNNPGSRTASVAAVVAFVNSTFHRQRKRFQAQDIVGALFGGLFETTAGVEFDFDDVTAALLRGVVPSMMPVWLSTALGLAGKLLGLSVAASITDRLIPRFVIDYCHRARLTPGDFVQDIMSCVRDLVTRCSHCWEERSLSPLITSFPRAAALKNATIYINMDSSSIPGEGSGVGLIQSRLAGFDAVVDETRDFWDSLSYGAEKGSALRILSALEIRREELCALWYGPSSRPRPVNFGVDGPPGIGKSLLSDIVAQVVMTSVGLADKCDTYSKYHKNAGFAFWDGFDMNLHSVIILDEMGASSKNNLKPGAYEETLKLLGEMSYELPMADVNKMGRQRARQICTVMISNVEDYGVEGVLQCPAALFRRFAGRIKVEAHESVRLRGSTEIDPEKLAKSGPDTVLWSGEVLIPKVQSATLVIWKKVGSFQTQRQLIGLLSPIAAARAKGSVGYRVGSEQRAEQLAAVCIESAGFVPTSGDDGAAPEQARGRIAVSYGARASTWRERVREAANLVGLSAVVDSCPDWESTARAGLLWVFLGLFFWWPPLTVGSALLFYAAYIRWSAQLMAVESGGPAPPFVEKFESVLSSVVAVYVSCWFLPWRWRLAVAAYSGPVIAAARNIGVQARLRQLELAKPVLGVMLAYGCWHFGGWLALKGRVWWNARSGQPEEPSPIGPVQMPNPPLEHTSGEPESYEEIRAMMRRNPVGWLSELKSRAPVDSGDWRERARGQVALGVISKELLPRADAGTGRDALRTRLVSNTFTVVLSGRVGEKSVSRRAVAVCLGGCFYAIPHHAFDSLDGVEVQLLPREPQEAGLLRKRVPIVEGVNRARVGDQDVDVLNLPFLPRQNVLQWSPADVAPGSPGAGTFACVLRPRGDAFVWDDTAVWAGSRGMPRLTPGRSFSDGLCLVLAAPSQAEMSGSPCVVSAGGGALFCGFVVGNLPDASGTQHAVVDVCTEAQLKKAMAVVTPSIVGFLPTSGIDFGSVVSDREPHERSWLAMADDRRFAVVAYTKGRVSYRSKFAVNPLTDKWPAIAEWVTSCGADDFVVPPFKAFASPDVSGRWAWRDPQLGKTAGMRGSTLMPPQLVRAAALSYVARFPLDLKRDDGCGPLTWNEAVFGGRGVPPLDLSRSAGDVGGLKLNHVNLETREISSSLSAMCDAILAEYRAGSHSVGRYRSVLKAELRKTKKCLAGQTRHISPTSFAQLIVQRAVMGPVVSAILAVGFQTSCMATGMNAADPRQWGGLRAWLLSRAKDGKFAEGDYADYDSNQQLDATQGMDAAVLGCMAERCGYLPADVELVENVVFLSDFNIVDVDGVQIVRVQGSDSGKYATDVRNNLQNYCKLFCAFEICAATAKSAGSVDFPVPAFDDVVNVILLGDDHIMGIDPCVRGFFNARSIHAALAPYGDVYTTAKKTLDFDDNFKSPEESSFLARTWRAVEGPNGTLWSAPLELERIAKSSRVVILKPSLTQAGLCESISANAQHELFLHGRFEFDRYQAALPGGPVVLSDGSTCRPRLWSFEELEEKWSRGMLATWDSGGQIQQVSDAPAPVAIELTSGSDTAVVLGSESAATEVCEEATAIIATENVASVRAAGAPVVDLPRVGTYDDWFARPVLVQTLTVQATDSNAFGGHYAELNIFRTWVQIVSVARKLANNRYAANLRGRLHISIGSTPQHRGMIVFGIVPCQTAWRALQAQTFPNQIVQMGGIVANLTGPSSLEMSFPITNPAGVFLMESDTDNLAGMRSGPVLMTGLLSKLTHCSLATAPSITILVRCCLESANFFGPTDVFAYTVTSGADKIKKGSASVAKESTQAGLVSRPAMIAAGLADQLSSVPFLAPFATPAAMLARGVAGLAALFGFGRPASREPTMVMTQVANMDLCRAVGNDPLPVADLDPAATSSPFPGSAGWDPTDQMSAEFLGSRWSIVGGSSLGAEWLTSTAVGATLMTIPVSPATIDLGLDASAPVILQPIMLIGGSHVYWRGTARFKIVVSAGSMDGGRLRVVYSPGSGSTLSTLDPIQKYSAIIDICDTTEHEFTVGWHSATTSLLVPQRFADLPATVYSLASAGGAFANGVLRIQADSLLVSSLATTGVGVKVFVKWEDIVFQRQSERLWNTMTFTSGKDVPDRGTNADLIYSGSGLTRHLRPVLQRYHVMAEVSPLKAAVGTLAGQVVWSAPAYGYGDDAAPTTVPTLRHHHPWDICLRAFSVFRGGVRHRMVIGRTGGALIEGCVCAAQGFWNYCPSFGAQYTDGAGYVTNTGNNGTAGMLTLLTPVSYPDLAGFSIFRGDAAGLWGVTTPWFNTLPWCTTGSNASYGMPSSAGGGPGPTVAFAFGYSNGGAAAPPWNFTQLISFADDVVLAGFVAMPVCTGQLFPI